jgi:hypothetical protein
MARVIDNRQAGDIDQAFWTIVTKFHITDLEITDTFEMFQKGAQKYKGSRLEAFAGFSIKNMRIDAFKDNMKSLSKLIPLNEELDAESENESWSVIDKIFFQERCQAFEKKYPELAQVFNAWKAGREVSDLILNRLTEKFRQLDLE